ncbi:PKD domain-containing protein [Noviherbaspirillum pedocola]|uniref:PKD domain-containing protein n=1 Tax=Noviherbaspirillum pedocola TaxID=2801341 RepID=A0A934SUM6_9BURK|nr:PKD domain-containing protein [Noviherbaspirillum pedocola]MBK4735588.1 PKD domain-containing protein [Noviherbaspirillum pedocola]
MRTTTNRFQGLQRWAAMIAAVILSAACGGEGGTPTSSGTPATKQLAAATVASTVASSYSVRNLPTGFNMDRPERSLNDNGQVCGYLLNPVTGILRAIIYEDGNIRNLSKPDDQSSWIPQAINANGWVTGLVRSPTAGTSFFIYDRVGTYDLGKTGERSAQSIAINDEGLIAGTRNLLNGDTDSFVYDFNNDIFANFGMPPGAKSMFAKSMNNLGQVTGYYVDQNSSVFGFVYTEDKTVRITETAPQQRVSPIAINDRAQVAGQFFNGTADHAFRYENEQMVDLGALEDATNSSTAIDINIKGEVIGSSENRSHQTLAFMHDGITMRAIGTLGGDATVPRSINAGSLVVGQSLISKDTTHAFVWSPIDGKSIDLNRLIPTNLGIELSSAAAISNSGTILANSNIGWVLLYPNAASNSPSTLGPILANDPAPIGSQINASMKFSDTDSADTHTASWSWGDGSTSVGNVTEPSASVAGSIAASHVYTTPGVYNITVTVTDSGGKSSSVGGQVVVYDPNGGFVAGGGWINSPVGAYQADPTMGGRATFGFTSKYLKGATKPSGQTEFQFQSANLNFHSTDYDWLVVGGARAQYKGTGTINGSGSYKFLLTAVDGDLIGKGTPDRLRMRIWHYNEETKTEMLDYDNQLDSGTEGGNLEGTAIGGGSISIKTK